MPSHSPIPSRRLPHARQRGVALIIVLSVLVLLTGLILAFFSSVTTESITTEGRSQQAAAQQLGESAVQMVIGQIIQATSQGPTVAWASQPGAIRTFGNGGQPIDIFKLYTSTQMVAGSVSGELPTANWNVVGGSPRDYSAQWADLNSPAITAAGTPVFPIVDPRAMSGAATESVVGFSYTNAIPGAVLPPGGGTSDSQRLPMPVRWMYVLQDGTLVTPAGGGAGSITVAGATQTNPITGRIAFWTDDDTSRININTAAGDAWDANPGAFWDTPRAETEFERALAERQPARGEYQRFPGHPSSVYLSAVFRDLTRADIGSISPRVEDGGSQGGTKKTTEAQILPPDQDRLYASVDELLYRPLRTTTPTAITADSLAKRRFFITAQSRAPEVNLFGQPRVAIWPVSATDSDATRSQFDKLLAFCSTIGGRPYYFTRANNVDPSAEFDASTAAGQRNQQLYAYLQRLTSTPIPGYGGKYTDRFSVADRNQLLTEIFDYVRITNLHDDQVTTKFTPNESDPTHGQVTPVVHPLNQTKGLGRFYTLSKVGLEFICNATGEKPGTFPYSDSNNPAKNKLLGGTALGQSKKLIQAILLLEFWNPALGWTGMYPDIEVEVEFRNALSIGGTSLGFPTSIETYSRSKPYAIHNRYYGATLDFRAILSSAKLPQRGTMPADTTTGSLYPFVGAPIPIDIAPTMSFSGGEIVVRLYSGRGNNRVLAQESTINFEPATLPQPTLVTTGIAQGGIPVANETKTADWWTFGRNSIINGPSPASNGGRLATVSQNHIRDDLSPLSGSFIRSGSDVVISYQVRSGDYRTAAALSKLPAEMFEPNRRYGQSGVQMQHNFANGVNVWRQVGADFDENALVYQSASTTPSVAYSRDSRPDVPPPSSPADPVLNASRTGDWDTGMALVHDGAYINKPDEGNVRPPVPYFLQPQNLISGGANFFSPNRLVPSAAMFGSLPTYVLATRDAFVANNAAAAQPWHTLLFRPDQTGTHPGLGVPTGAPPYTAPPDYLLLDLFWMPIVEPYAVSEPFSTAGKINLNYRMLPFDYIERSTAVRAAMRSEQILAIPVTAGQTYKEDGASNPNYRRRIDVASPTTTTTGTLSQFESRFNAGELFRSEAELARLYLVPEGETVTGMTAFWNDHRLTGDNVRERPYANLLPKFTTKSNTYTVYYRAQALKKRTSGNQTDWDETADTVAAEYRGATTIERYIDDPGDPTLPDFATDATATVAPLYRFRVTNNVKFTP